LQQQQWYHSSVAAVNLRNNLEALYSVSQNFLKYCHSGSVCFHEILPISCQFILTFTNLGQFILIFNKHGINFSRSSYRFKFRVLPSQIALTSSLMMSGASSPNLSPLHYQVWGNAGVLSQAATKAQNSSRLLKCTSVNLVCVTGENCKRLQARMSANGKHFEH